MIFLSLKINFALENGADPDEMPCSAAFHLCLHYLQKYPLKGSTKSRLLLNYISVFLENVM